MMERATAAAPTDFNIETAVKDFAGPGRTVEQIDRGGRLGGVSYDRHIHIHVNGWTLSVTWNWGTYCTGAREGGGFDLDQNSPPESPDAEVAAWRCSGHCHSMIELDGDSVEGWVKPPAVMAAIEAAERDDEAGIRAALVRKDAS